MWSLAGGVSRKVVHALFKSQGFKLVQYDLETGAELQRATTAWDSEIVTVTGKPYVAVKKG